MYYIKQFKISLTIMSFNYYNHINKNQNKSKNIYRNYKIFNTSICFAKITNAQYSMRLYSALIY